MDLLLNDLRISAARAHSEMRQLEQIQFTQGSQSTEAKRDQIQKVAEKFESIFIRQMLSEMRNSVIQGGIFGQSHAEKMYQEMHDDFLAEEMAKGGGFGLGDLLVRELDPQAKRIGPKELQAYLNQKQASGPIPLEKTQNPVALQEAQAPMKLEPENTQKFHELHRKGNAFPIHLPVFGGTSHTQPQEERKNTDN